MSYHYSIQKKRNELKKIFSSYHKLNDEQKVESYYELPKLLNSLGKLYAAQAEQNILLECFKELLEEYSFNSLESIQDRGVDLLRAFGAIQIEGVFSNQSFELQEIHLVFPNFQAMDAYTIIVSANRGYGLTIKIVLGKPKIKSGFVAETLRKN